ncbi:MAG: Gfo/Idh/MocA family oxidoreductase [Propionibacterium sp.]|nr:Gfo/Idh/MocA family oxidoreductase [Propionibacterium sp.]
MTVRWAIAGTGKMAATFAGAFAHVPDADLVAVASRDAARATRFATEHGVPRAVGYPALWASGEVDAVYVASPHTSHAELALAAIAAGKAVLVEKAFTTSVADTEAVIAAARERGVFAMEAMWTRFLPAAVELKRLVDAGVIGQVRSVQGDLSAFRAYDPADRLFDRAAGGGATLDLGVYVVSFAQWLLGTPTRVLALGGLLPNGVDGEGGVLLGYDDGRYASLGFDFTAHGPGRMAVLGTEGWIDVKPRFHRLQRFEVLRPGAAAVAYDLPALGSGYAHELAEATRCIAAGLTESPAMPLADTLAVQRTLDAVQRAIHR